MTADNHDGCDVEVVIVARDHYSSTPRTVQAVIDTVDESVQVTLVPGALPSRLLSRLAAKAPGRVRCIGPRHHLIPNAARQIGLEQTSAHFVAFVDNDVIPEPGWLDELVRTAVENRATATRPLLLQRFGNEAHVTIHESGGICAIGTGPNGRTLVEHHRHMNDPVVAAEGMREQPVDLLEFHCVLFNRAELLAIGGFDTTIESQGEHLDVALRIAEHDGSIWLAPGARATVEFQFGLRPTDATFYLGRWSPRLNHRSKLEFNAKWGITDPLDSPSAWGFAHQARALAWMPLGKAAHRVLRRSTPSALAERFDNVLGRHIANGLVAAAPGWRSWRRSSGRQNMLKWPTRRGAIG